MERRTWTGERWRKESTPLDLKEKENKKKKKKQETVSASSVAPYHFLLRSSISSLSSFCALPLPNRSRYNLSICSMHVRRQMMCKKEMSDGQKSVVTFDGLVSHISLFSFANGFRRIIWHRVGNFFFNTFFFHRKRVK